MPIIDERRVSFDLGALKDVIMLSQFAAMSIGLPNNLPSGIGLDASAYTVNFDFAGNLIMVTADKVGALLISYCIRSGIRVPRQTKRTVIVEERAITLVFREDYLMTPAAKPDQPQPNVRSRTYQYHSQ